MATADNLKLAQQLLATMQQISMQADKQTEAYRAQAQFVDAICRAQDCFNKFDANKLNEIRDSLGNAQQTSERFGESMKKATEQGGFLSDKIKSITSKLRKLAVPAEFINGFKAGLNFTKNMLQGLMKLGGVGFGLIKDLGMIFLSIPGRIMDFFQGAAGGGSDPYRQALEDLRKEFGNLELGTSAAIKNMTESTKDLGESGLALSRVFGYGREGLAKMLQENMELFKGMGPLGNRLAASIRGAEGEFTLFRKATNLSAEAMKSLQLTAEASGGDTAEAIRSMTKDIARAERAFGISAKEYGKDIDFMMKETATFGVMAPREMLKVSTYVKKLGVSMETLKKVMDKTMNFEDAAQQAAKLSEAFNIQIDAVKMMNEQDPTKKLDMIREGFFKAGRDIERMTVLEKKYLAEQTNMSDEEMRVAFSQKNRAVTGAALDAQMKKAQKTQISQAEAMQQLAKSIERLVQSGSAMKGGFLEIFMKGFFSGIRRTKEFRSVVYALQRSMRAVYMAGRQVGRMFVQLFPGVKQMLQGLRGLFDPARYRSLMKNVVEEFRKFFTMLKTDPRAGFENFMKNMKKLFFDFFTKGSPAGSKFLDGLKTFFKTVGIIFVQGIKYALGAMKDLLKAIIGFIKDPSSLTNAAGEMGDGLAGMFKSALVYAITELGPALKEVGGLFVELLKTLYEKYIQPHLKKIIFTALTVLFGPALVAGFVRGTIAALFGQGIPAIFKYLTETRKKADSATRGGAEEDGGGGTKSPEQSAKDAEKKSGGLLKMAKSIMAFTFAISAIMAAIIVLAALYEQFNVKPESILVMLVLFGAVTLLFYGMLKLKFFDALKELGETMKGQSGNLMKGLGVGLGVIAALMISVAVLVALGAKIISAVNPDSVDLFLDVLDSMAVLLLKLSVVVAVIALVGAAIYASGGTALAVLGAGLLTLGVLLLLIAGFATGALVAFKEGMDKANISPEYAKQVTGLLSDFVDMVIKLSSAIAELSLSAPFAAVGGAISKLFGTQNPFDALNDVLEIITDSFLSIMDSLKEMKEDPAILKARAQIFTTVATGLASLILPITEVMNSLSGGLLSFLNTNVVQKSGEALIDIITVLADKDKGIIPKLMDHLQEMSNKIEDPAKLKTTAEVFSILATGLGEIFKSVGELIGQFTIEGGMFSSIIGSVAGIMAKFEVLDKIIYELLPMIKRTMISMIKSMVDISANITNVEGLKALGSVLTAAGNIMVSMLTAVTKVMDKEGIGGAIDSFNNLISGGSASNLSDQRLNQVSTFINSFSRSIGTMMTNILTGVTTLAERIPTDTEKLKALNAATEIIKAVTSMIGPLLSAVGTIVQASTKNVRTITGLTAMGEFLKNLVENLTTALGNVLTKQLPDLVQKLMEIPIAPGLEAKVKALKSIFDLVSTLASITSSIRIPTGGKGDVTRQLNVFSEIFEPVMSLLGYLFVHPIYSGLLQLVINRLAGRGFGNLAASAGRAKGVKSIFEMVKSVADATKALTELSPTGSINPTVFTNILVSTSSIITSLTASIPGGNPFTDRRFADMLQPMDANLKVMEPRLKRIAEKLQGVSSTAQTLTGIRFVGIENIRQMVSEYNQFATELSRLDTASGNTGPIEVAIRRLNTRLQGARVATIQNAAVHAQINVVVKMEAGELTSALHTYSTQRNQTGSSVSKPAIRLSSFVPAGQRE